MTSAFISGLKARAEHWIVPLLLGALTFFGVTGGRIFSPRNIAWLDRGDPAQYFLGWHFFRNSPWGFPLGASPRYGAEFSSSIVYADCLPLFALPFKLVRRWLPDTFQYFGFWILCCFVLQAWFAWLLLGLITQARLARGLGTLLFVFAPPFLWRLSGHYQLMGQWLVLAALYLCFGRRELARGAAWPLLSFCAGLVHSYLTAMVLALWLSDWLRRVLFDGRTRGDLIQLPLVPAAMLLAQWQAGVFMIGSGALRRGFGFHQMNLLSLFDAGGWSYFLPDMPGSRGDYEGFNYFGPGSLLLLIAILPSLRGAFGALRRRRGYWPLAALLVALSLFALSNRVAIAGHLLTIPLPQAVLERANLLRSSGRMFWPAFYVLLWLVIRALFSRYSPRVALALLFVATLLQVADTTAGTLPIRRDLHVSGRTWESPLRSPFWTAVPAEYDEIRQILPRNEAPHHTVFAYFAAMHGMSTDFAYLARIDSQKFEQANDEATQALSLAKYRPRTLYVVDRRYAAEVRRTANETALLRNIDGYLVLAPHWRCSPHCAARDAQDCAPDCTKR